MAEGICKLTLKSGQFVRSHLLPLALTGARIRGAPLIQFNSGKRPSRKWSSWYDERLVTRDGEDILSGLDNWAIAALRLHSLVWSGWGKATALPPTHAIPQVVDFLGARFVSGVDFARLRLFLLSLLWRAAATARGEFSEVIIPEEHLELLRRALIDDTMPDEEFYPAALTQLSTKGIKQNLVPLAQMMPIPNLEGGDVKIRPIFRFYFDGLVVHFHRSTSGLVDEIRPFAVGASDTLVVPLISYERSFQRENLLHVLRESKP